ncbi:MAG: class I SAM-dependent methyltransferase [Candidatus Muirbacterium halophilum]|nr:class I SAM-dependent methyltransferase [Candidatus Muirbacterium halophilum]MCK9474970.1 class I SAM-dependent methyltransferase [Candidatus Muirbacterium halophilum]
MKNNNRFLFGKNWKNFLKKVNSKKIKVAEESIKDYIYFENIKGKSFLDIGCGSGLFSLAAKNLGAKVFSFDYDKECVNCAKILKNKFYKNNSKWKITQGDILNNKFINSIEKFDIVYSWGVLHHTGNLWQALENTSKLVKNEGIIFISLYNNQGFYSKIWSKIKKTYNNSNFLVKLSLITFFYIFFHLRSFIIMLFKTIFFKTKVENNKDISRGMDWITDLIDWIGGYPFEVSTPDEIFEFFHNKGFILKKLKTCRNGHGCNEFVFKKANK